MLTNRLPPGSRARIAHRPDAKDGELFAAERMRHFPRRHRPHCNRHIPVTKFVPLRIELILVHPQCSRLNRRGCGKEMNE
jgi:hypothetical protein